MIACAVTDFPDPDSPRMASVSPSWRSKETPLMALATPSRVRNSTCSWSTSSSRPSTGLSRCPGVEDLDIGAFRRFRRDHRHRCLLSAVSDRGRRGRRRPA